MGRLRALDPLLHFVPESIYEDGDKVIKSITNLITNNIEPPFSIAINGSWGGGKTTMLSLLQKNLEEAGHPTLWFNPWEYEGTNDVALAFMQQIALRFMKHFDIKDIGIFAMSLLTVGMDAIAQALTNKIISYKNIGEIVENMSNICKSNSKGKYIDPIKIIQDDFVKLTKLAMNKYQSKSLIIFLDDLDRCLPENAVKLLEMLKNLFVIKGAKVVIISGIDISIARKFIQKRYYDLSPDFATNYFKKIFNLTIDIPAISNSRLKNYLSSYIRYIFNEEENKSIINLEEITALTVNLFNISGINSIRRILMILNQLYVFKKTKPQNQDLNDNIILPLLFLKEVWSSFFSDISEKAKKYHNSSLKVFLETEGYLDKNLTKKGADKNFYLFLQNYCVNETAVRTLIKSNLM